jgi:Bacterial low temperature requirement A protein (LtrA)
MIIAIGESIVAIGAGAGTAVTEAPVMAAALLGLIAAICVWWLYFANAARAASRGLAATPIERRGNGYSLSHIPLIAGILLTSLGIEEVIAHVAESPAGHPADAPLDWISTTALYGSAVLFSAAGLRSCAVPSDAPRGRRFSPSGSPCSCCQPPAASPRWPHSACSPRSWRHWPARNSSARGDRRWPFDREYVPGTDPGIASVDPATLLPWNT